MSISWPRTPMIETRSMCCSISIVRLPQPRRPSEASKRRAIGVRFPPPASSSPRAIVSSPNAPSRSFHSVANAVRQDDVGVPG